MKTDTLKVPATKPAISPSKTTTPQMKFGSGALKPAPRPPGPVIAGEERRRSQRVLLRARASLHVTLHGKPQRFEVTTLSVNSHGAVIVMERTLPAGSPLILEHSATKQRVACKITRPPREMPEGYHVPLEFDSPAPEFWGISFPPSDWRPPDDL